ncbi:MAG: Protein TolR [uncultured Thiotrichaceae bacterium]|uniref:Protein TolR n=1 Tax=uncultured Thiotrichaceae bacterium TaxID=298394 RepID=A0A6S6U1M1_9GAMM|nr:MAG: Protein TolR [uncultured Thiotrichaceae bacterium]
MARRQRKAMAQLNVVPYIDVMLVLLIIFMVTAPMLQTGLEINLPEINADSISTDNEQEPLLIGIDTAGKFYLGEEEMADVTELSQRISEKLTDKKQAIHIRGDQAAQYSFIMQAVAAAQQAGASHFAFISDSATVDGQEVQ